jgi:hypothetical protein
MKVIRKLTLEAMAGFLIHFTASWASEPVIATPLPAVRLSPDGSRAPLNGPN